MEAVMGTKDVSIGVDLGGTKILVAVFDGDMAPLATVKGKTPGAKGEDAIVDAIAALSEKSLAEAGLAAADLARTAVTVPGPVDRKTGKIILAPNLGLKDYPMAEKLGAALGASKGHRVTLHNDVIAGVWGEYRAGAARGFKDVIGVFIGTGIGGGIIIDGKLLRGAHGHAGEVGHMIVSEGGSPCACGQYGCLEALCSRTAMSKEAVAAAASGRSPGFLEDAGTDFRKYRSGVIDAGIKRKDPAALRIVDRAAFWAGVGMANLVNVLDPEAIVLGGGIMSRFGDRFLERAAESMRNHLMPGIAKGVRVLLSELGDLAVATGAVILARDDEASA
jgi:glucokinase